MREYKGKRVLVTGASGFIGGALVRTLVAQEAVVFAASRSEHYSPFDNVTWLRSDLTSLQDTRRLFADSEPEVVFHLASQVSGARELEHVGTMLQANLVTAVNVMTCSTESCCERVVLAGSMEEPGEDEVPAVPSSPYAAAKWAASGYARMFHALYRTPIVVARIFMVYGPGQLDFKKLIPYVSLCLLRRESPKVSLGARPVDWIFVEDVVEGLLALGIVSGVIGKEVELGSGVTNTVRDVVDTLVDIVDPSVEVGFGAVPPRPMETTRVASVRRTAALTGWEPVTDLRPGLERTVDWYRRHAEELDE